MSTGDTPLASIKRPARTPAVSYESRTASPVRDRASCAALQVCVQVLQALPLLDERDGIRAQPNLRSECAVLRSTTAPYSMPPASARILGCTFLNSARNASRLPALSSMVAVT